MGENRANRIPNPMEEFTEIPSGESLYESFFIYLFFGVMYGIASSIFAGVIGFIIALFGYGIFVNLHFMMTVIVVLILPMIGYVLCILSMVKRPGIRTRVMLRIAGFSMGFFITAFVITLVVVIRIG